MSTLYIHINLLMIDIMYKAYLDCVPLVVSRRISPPVILAYLEQRCRI
jgi:hypothetical protein